jgi:DNA-binding transcriptional LysR family regulator
MEQYPNIDIRVTEGTSGFLEKELIAEKIDICVILTLPITLPDIDYEFISDEQLMVVVPANHEMFNGSPPPPLNDTLYYIDSALLDGQPYVSLTPEHGLYRAANHMFEYYGISPKTVIELSNTSTAFYLASQGMGFTIMPVRHMRSVKYETRPIFCTTNDPPEKRSIVAAYKRGRVLPEAARHFFEAARLVSENPAVKSPVMGVSYWKR